MLAKEIMTKTYISIDQNETVSKLIGQFSSKKQKEAIIVDNGNYVGVVSKKSMIDSRIKVNEIKIKNFIKKVHRIGKYEDLRKVCEEMISSDTHILPVLNEYGKVEGVVFANDAINSLQSHAKGYKAKDIEKTKLITLEQSTPIGKAINILHNIQINHIPITDKQGKLVGIVGTLDLLGKFSLSQMQRPGNKNIKGKMNSSAKQKNLMKQPIQNEMIKNVEIIEEEEPLTKAIDIMIRKNLSDVIVTRNGTLTGIITTKDLLRLFSVI